MSAHTSAGRRARKGYCLGPKNFDPTTKRKPREGKGMGEEEREGGREREGGERGREREETRGRGEKEREKMCTP